MAMTKTLLGQKVRRLRQERKLTQQQMAERLGISASYLNLIEHDERPVTVALLLKLGKTFDIDLQELSDDSERRLAVALREVFADAGLGASEVDPDEIRRLVASAPKAGRAIVDLYRAWRAAREDAQALQLNMPGGRTRRIALPTEEAREFFEAHANYFGAIEDAAEAQGFGDAGERDIGHLLADRLARDHGIGVTIAPIEQMEGALRRYDPKARTLALSEVLPLPSRHFHLAYQLGLVAARAAFDETIRATKLAAPESEILVRVGLANYFAAAVLMPYAAFLALARTARYDIERLMHRFGVSFEQAAQRVSSLQRPGECGIPFFFGRVDIAGNLTKRFSAAGFHFSRYACPRLVLHEAFATPGLIRTQIATLPDGAAFFCIARTVEKPGGGFNAPVTHESVGLGCDLGRAAELVYADGRDLTRLDAATGIGLGCRLCERSDCRQRAFPPLHHRLIVDETVRGPSAYAFTPRPQPKE